MPCLFYSFVGMGFALLLHVFRRTANFMHFFFSFFFPLIAWLEAELYAASLAFRVCLLGSFACLIAR